MIETPPPSPSVRNALLALLEWYDAMGVHAVVGDSPVDRFAESARDLQRRAAAARPPAGTPGQPSVLPPPTTRTGLHSGMAPPAAAPYTASDGGTADDAVMAARRIAASAGSLEELRELLARFDGCTLKRTARNLVFGDGRAGAPLMIVGEAPGREEDAEGRPFVGPSGMLLDRMLAAAGLDRARDAYIANVVYWRPPGNRPPSDLEVAVCRPFIMRQIELVGPKVLVFLGGQPAKALLGGSAARTGIVKLRGRWTALETGVRTIRAMPTLHPAYLLRRPIEKRLAWRDLLEIRAALRED